MPKLVSTMTPMRSGRFGPKKLTNGPAISLPSAGMSDSVVRASVKPPLFTSNRHDDGNDAQQHDDALDEVVHHRGHVAAPAPRTRR